MCCASATRTADCMAHHADRAAEELQPAVAGCRVDVSGGGCWCPEIGVSTQLSSSAVSHDGYWAQYHSELLHIFSALAPER